MAQELKCPTCSVPLVFNKDEAKFKCQLCGFEIEAMEWGSEKPETGTTVEQMKDALRKASEIVESPMDRKVNLKLTIGGETGKYFQALQTLLIEGLGMDQQVAVAEVIKTGINFMSMNFTSLLQFRENADRIVESGGMRRETLDNLFADMANFGNRELGKDWQFGGEE